MGQDFGCNGCMGDAERQMLYQQSQLGQFCQIQQQPLIRQSSIDIQLASPSERNITQMRFALNHYMLKKQETLHLHLNPCEKLKARSDKAIRNGRLDQVISESEFQALLVNLKLLQADAPSQDDRWLRFYSKLQVVDETSAQGVWYDLTPIMIALFALSQGTNGTKAKAICELFTIKKLLKPADKGIRAKRNAAARDDVSTESRPSLDEFIRKAHLRKDQLRMILSILVNLSFYLLPMFASDIDKRYLSLLNRTIADFRQKHDFFIKVLLGQFKTPWSGHGSKSEQQL